MTRPRKNWLEWAVFALGVVLMAATIGYLAYDAVSVGDGPPNVEVRLGEPRRTGTHFLVAVTVVNRGAQTAEGVHVEVELHPDRGESERAGFVIPYLPRHSSREGWVTFRSDPRTARGLDARARGFEKP